MAIKLKRVARVIYIALLAIAVSVSILSCKPKASIDNLDVYWTKNSEAAKSLRDYVTKVTDPNDKKNYIPEKDRIAVFDMDGTLVCETYFTYYDTMMFIDYCLKDNSDKVSPELRKIAESIKPGYVADEALARNFAKAYAGMTVEEFYNYAVEFGKRYTKSFNNMRYIDNFYLPMVELVKYLYGNKFTIYVISGTERTTTRAIIANSPIKDFVNPRNVIGTEFEIKQKGHEKEASNMNFKYAPGDGLVLTGGFIQKNLNGNKSIWIEKEIGQRPVLAFGNSGSDTSMMNYTIDGRNIYPAEAYMVIADDDVREWGKQDFEKKSEEYRAEGYIPISMKNDFAEIYDMSITKAAEQYVESDETVDQTTTNSENLIVELPKNAKMEFLDIKAGTFTMGAKDGENFVDEEEHQVALKQDFYLGKTEVTQSQWEAVMGSNPSHFKGENLPVESVTWDDAMAFCKKLNDSGLAPAGMKFSLPTEAQWEYAALGGSKSSGYQYSGSDNLNEVAWYYENSGDRHLDEKELIKDVSDPKLQEKLEDNSVIPEVDIDFEKLDKNLKENNNKTHPVGLKKANELGLYDMSGSVWEWCLDQYEGDYADDPEFLAGNDGSNYVFRGGGWRGTAGGCRSANRHGDTRDYTCYDLGFRVALVQAQ